MDPFIYLGQEQILRLGSHPLLICVKKKRKENVEICFPFAPRARGISLIIFFQLFLNGHLSSVGPRH